MKVLLEKPGEMKPEQSAHLKMTITTSMYAILKTSHQ